MCSTTHTGIFSPAKLNAYLEPLPRLKLLHQVSIFTVALASLEGISFHRL